MAIDVLSSHFASRITTPTVIPTKSMSSTITPTKNQTPTKRTGRKAKYCRGFQRKYGIDPKKLSKRESVFSPPMACPTPVVAPTVSSPPMTCPTPAVTPTTTYSLRSRETDAGPLACSSSPLNPNIFHDSNRCVCFSDL